ncbi:hypothetical protein ACFL55_01060 [Candidatus Latescibacterota bacterium]
MHKLTWFALVMALLFIPLTSTVDCLEFQTFIMNELQGLIDTVDEIDQKAGIINCLDAKITSIQRAVSDIKENNDVAALNSIESFIHIVEIQRGNQLTVEQADNLITVAGNIRYYIENFLNGDCPLCGGNPCIPPCSGI